MTTSQNVSHRELYMQSGNLREVGFLGVVIGPEGIKMEVKGVLDWLTK